MKTPSHIILILGATGDLTKRKLIPSLYHLILKERLTSCTPIVCIGRKPLSKNEYIELLEPARFIENVKPEILEDLLDRIEYISFDTANEPPEKFNKDISSVRERYDCAPNYLVYLALPTSVFAQSVQLVSTLQVNGGWRRVVFEKPFGEDLPSAIKLNESVLSILQEDEVFRVDHYLGKQLVQNILTLRFANEIFSRAWRHEAIDHVQITVAETLGVEKRAGYYDKSGAIRDMLQNHLLQLLSLIAMEPPAESEKDSMRDASVNVLRHLRQPRREDIVLGQYSAGKKEKGYLDEERIQQGSTTETYVALRAFIDTDRWRGVPFYIRTGKRMHRRFAEIRIIFRQDPGHFPGVNGEPNEIIIRIQPDEGMALAFNVQKPGEQNETESVLMDFCHHCHFGPNTPEAYEAILYNIMSGDHTLFPRRDWIEASWKYTDLLRSVAPPPQTYPAGSKGPENADALLARDGRQWLEDPPVTNRLTGFPA